jgi:ribonuclease Z
VSHTHIDHFVGFDRLLRLLVGREKTINLYGPSGFIDRVGHKLRSYHWNLINRYPYDLVFVTTEIDSSLETRTVRFRLKGAFSGEAISRGRVVDGVVYSEPSFQVSVAFRRQGTRCAEVTPGPRFR